MAKVDAQQLKMVLALSSPLYSWCLFAVITMAGSLYCALAVPTLLQAEPTRVVTEGSMSSNRLTQEKSPYLLQHKDNPVEWYPWGEEAFQAAKRQGKPIFLSVGYSTCYWCHVMEAESFQSEEIAAMLNETCISIKVDREERPDIDAVYMDALIGMTGHGGWPMNVFLTHDLQPFFAGTYFSPEKFKKILQAVRSDWQDERASVESVAEQITVRLKELQNPEPIAEALSDSIFFRAATELAQRFDALNGGFGRAPKFPPASAIRFLLRFHRRSGAKPPFMMANKTLSAMARGGIYDQLGGGFHRYSTDEKWRLPHFEKMLYDNAQLAMAYSEAIQAKGGDFSLVLKETLDYVITKMSAVSGGFFSAEDAGPVGREGQYYLWSASELQELLQQPQYERLVSLFGITQKGNFHEGSNVLYIENGRRWEEKYDESLRPLIALMLKRRAEREAPHMDDKIITAWNGMMISALARASRVLGEQKYFQAARKAATFVAVTLYKDGRLYRRYRQGEVRFHGFLDDYVFMIEGLIELYLSDFALHWLEQAEQLQAILDREFWDKERGGYFYSDARDSSVLYRKRSFADASFSSPNSVALLNLLRLHALTYRNKYKQRAEELIAAAAPEVISRPGAHTSFLSALDFYRDQAKTLVIVGPLDSDAARRMFSYYGRTFLPNVLLVAGEPSPLAAATRPTNPLLQGKQIINGRTTFYVCQSGSCKEPTNSFDIARHELENFAGLREPM